MIFSYYYLPETYLNSGLLFELNKHINCLITLIKGNRYLTRHDFFFFLDYGTIL